MSSSIIKSDNGVTSGVTGIISSGGSDGTLLLQTTSAGGTATTALTIDNSQNLIPAVGILGVTNGSNASAGIVGEYVASTVTSFTGLTSGTNYNVTTISLTAGDWDVSGQVELNFAGTTNVTSMAGGINSTSATFGTNGTYWVYGQPGSGTSLGTQNTQGFTVPTQRFNLTTTTTIYLIAQSNFSVSTAQARGAIRARRVR